MKARFKVRVGGTALLMTATIASFAHSEPKPSISAQPATCRLWNDSTARSQLRLTLALWVRAYLEHERRVSFPRGYADRDLRRFLDQHCKSNAADDIQKAADALGQSFLSGGSGNVG